MADYEITDTSIITFHDLFKGEEEDGLILVGRQDIGSYVSLPAEAIEVIDLLDSGRPVGEVKKVLEQKYGEEVEIEEFIEDMIDNEMVHFVDTYEIETTSQEHKDLFSWITGDHVTWLFSKGAWFFYGGTVAACVIIFAVHPHYIPEPVDFFWHPWYSVAVGLMAFCGWILVAIHEIAHLFAAKAVGTGGYFSLSNRLIFVVAQTNLGNIWVIPRKNRYIVYFAGMAWDSVMIFVCLALLLIHDYHLAVLPDLGYTFLKALIFIKVWGIIWQFRFNMQTDIYYAVGNYFKCRNLLGDAQTNIKNFFSKFVKRISYVDLGDMPDYELRAVKWYTLLYIVGTSVTLATYFFRNLPLLILQIKRAYYGIIAGYTADPAHFIDAVVLVTLSVFNFGLLGFLLLRPRWDSIKQWVHGVFK
ncbi:MAG: hypothetical protein PVF58_11520 [Candidatus Methanofastidiosia archaeon]|jgi:hypothetical protein